MATFITPVNATTDLAAEGALIAANFTTHECAYCRSSIAPGQRWVREKIHEPLSGSHPRYRRYHADLFAGQELCCWEKHELEIEIARAASRVM